MTSTDATSEKQLASEYLIDPFAEPTPGLKALLDQLRDESPKGRLVLLQDAPHPRWWLARLDGRRGEPPQLVDQPPFHDLADAARAIFRMRWLRTFALPLPE